MSQDAVRTRTFSAVKEAMAAGRLTDESAGAMVAELLEHNPTIEQPGYRGLTHPEARRIAAMVSLGKRIILFRHGLEASEREGAMQELAPIVKMETTRGGQPRFRFSMAMSEAVSLVAIDELTISMCPSCSGAREVPMYESNPAEGRQPMMMCPTCFGSGKREYDDYERREAVRDAARVRGVMQEELDRRLERSPDAVTWAKTKLLEAERIAVEETAAMAERW